MNRSELICQLEAIARQIAEIQQMQVGIVLPDQPPIEVRGIAKEPTFCDRHAVDREI